MLVAPGGTITLIHSQDTADVARRLRGWLQVAGEVEHVDLKHVNESNPTSIARAVKERLTAVPRPRVGLNYTGGTKAMSVHAYRTIEQLSKETNSFLVFSYLDARELALVINFIDPALGESAHTVYVGRALDLRLGDLLSLHGWTPRHPPTLAPLLSDSAHILARICGDDVAFGEWMQWIDDELRPKCRRTDKEDWKNKTQLKAITLTWPTSDGLQEVVNSICLELNMPRNNLTLEHSAFDYEPKRFCEWIFGKWLEHYVLDVLKKLPASLCLHECMQNIVPNEVEFDVDVMALHSYQLFAFSCSTDSKKSLLKLKLFEAFVRARQLGGDEARMALICCSDSPEELEQQMRRDLGSEGQIRVFGRKSLPNFSIHLSNWIQSQIGEAR